MNRSAPTINQWLNEYGLLLCAFKWGELPKAVSDVIEAALPRSTTDSTPNATNFELTIDTQLLLLANAGPIFWRCLQRSSTKNHTDPVDTFSQDLAKDFHKNYLSDGNFTQLYPTPDGQAHIPLMQLGRLAGWNIPSPLGLGLHPEFGPWSAYRVAWLTQSNQLPKTYYQQPKPFKPTDLHSLQASAELCVSCSAPCASACPAAAVTHGEYFNVERCYQHSRPENSDCHTHCFARIACPIGTTHRYDDKQLVHHMKMRWR